MASVLCPHCKCRYIALPVDFHDRIQCTECGRMFVAEIRNDRARTAMPATFVLDPPPGMDPHLVSDLSEAVACFNADAFRATVVMARRFLEALLDQRGFRGRTLLDRIRAAEAAGIANSLQVSLMSSARILGNYGAHYSDDELAQIGQPEAELVLTIVRQIVKTVAK
jgi:hypothetical protein